MEDRKIFEDRFRVTAIDPNNNIPFRNVSRVHMISEYELQMQVDINIQIYPVSTNDSFLIKVINCENIRNIYSQDEINKPSEKDNFDYVTYGSVFEIHDKDAKMEVYASFGGLLMCVKGKSNALSAFRKDGTESRVYLMIRRA